MTSRIIDSDGVYGHETGLQGNSLMSVDYKNSDGFNIAEILRVLLRWWWLIAAITLISTLLTFYFVNKVTPVYMASSIIEIKQQERQIFDQNSDVENFVVDSEFFNTQIELLKSDSLADDIIKQFNLTSDSEFVINPEGSREAKRLSAINSFSNKLRVGAVGRSRLIRVSFEHTSPDMAAKIAHAVTDSFITCLLYTSPSPRDATLSRMPSSA